MSGRGRSTQTIELINACFEIAEERQPITVRGIAYVLFGLKRIPDVSKRSTSLVSRLTTDAREEGILPWEWIVDESRDLEMEAGFRDLRHFGAGVARAYRRSFWGDQPYALIVVSEKATVSGLLRPIIDQYGIHYLPVHGFNSAGTMQRLVQIMARDRRHYIFLYVGDWDPSGLWMSERDWFVTGSDYRFPRQTEKCNRLIRYGADPKKFFWKRIALVEADLGKGLPSFEAKKKIADPRYQWFVQNYGKNCVELDAMDPRTLRQRVEDEILRHIDPSAWGRHEIIEAAEMRSCAMVQEFFDDQVSKMGLVPEYPHEAE